MEGIPQSQSATGNLKPKWQERFAFFEQHGAPTTASYKAAFRALPFRKRILINSNFIGFFFGPIYWFVLGMWKKNLVMLGGMVVVSVLLGLYEMSTGTEIPRPVDNGINMAFAFLYMFLTNRAYYLKQAKGVNGWNPFEGQRMI